MQGKGPEVLPCSLEDSRPVEDKPAGGTAAGGTAAGGMAAGDKPAGDKPAGGRLPVGKPAGEVALGGSLVVPVGSCQGGRLKRTHMLVNT